MAKYGSDLCNFYSKLDFWEFFIRKNFLLFFIEFKLLVYHNNILKITEILNNGSLLKTSSA